MPNMQDMPRTAIQLRLKELRGALGLQQSELSHLIGVGQPEIWRWENNPDKPRKLDGARDRYTEFASLLASRGPETRERYEQIKRGKVVYGRLPEEYSPLEDCLGEIPEWVETLFNGSDEDWEQVKEALPFSSIAPWKRSELIRLDAMGDIGPHFNDNPPYPVDAIEADLKVHGREFVKSAIAMFSDPEYSDEAIDLHCAMHSGQMAVRMVSAEVFDIDEVYGSDEADPSLAGKVSARWKGRDYELWLPAMDFLSFALESCWSGIEGDWDMKKLYALKLIADAYPRDAETRRAIAADGYKTTESALSSAMSEALEKAKNAPQA